MFEAYRGTIDDEGETLDDARQEVQRTLSGANGAFLPNCSWLLEEAGAIQSACLVTHFADWQAPLIAFVMTLPTAKGRGMAQELIRRSMNSLLEQGYSRLCLAVTEGNLPAQHIYKTLGFVVEESWTR
jgi:GNAT superfamily N-acetyltransferase